MAHLRPAETDAIPSRVDSFVTPHAHHRIDVYVPIVVCDVEVVCCWRSLKRRHQHEQVEINHIAGIRGGGVLSQRRDAEVFQQFYPFMSERSLNGGCAILIVKVGLDCRGADDRYSDAVALTFLFQMTCQRECCFINRDRQPRTKTLTQNSSSFLKLVDGLAKLDGFIDV